MPKFSNPAVSLKSYLADLKIATAAIIREAVEIYSDLMTVTYHLNDVLIYFFRINLNF